MFVRGPASGARAPTGRAPFVRAEAPPASSGDLTGGLLGTLDRFCSVLPPRLKLELSQQVISWAEAKRQDALRALSPREPEPAPRDERDTIDTEGWSR